MSRFLFATLPPSWFIELLKWFLRKYRFTQSYVWAKSTFNIIDFIFSLFARSIKSLATRTLSRIYLPGIKAVWVVETNFRITILNLDDNNLDTSLYIHPIRHIDMYSSDSRGFSHLCTKAWNTTRKKRFSLSFLALTSTSTLLASDLCNLYER